MHLNDDLESQCQIWIDPINGDSLALQSQVINIASEIDKVRSNSAGANSVFIGTTRDLFEDQRVTHLSYEAYPDMAIESMKEIVKTIRSRWAIERVVIVHKIGDCPAGEASVLIAISSTHRTESLQAVEFAINELKRIVPIWKKELYETGTAQWKENKESFNGLH